MFSIRLQIWGTAVLLGAAVIAVLALGSGSREGGSEAPSVSRSAEAPSGVAPGSGPAAGGRAADPSPPSAPENSAMLSAPNLPSLPSGSPIASPEPGPRQKEARRTPDPALKPARAAGRGRAASAGRDEHDPVESRLLEKALRRHELEESALAYAREMGLEVPPEILEAIDNLERLPGEDQPAFRERQEGLEREALLRELVVEAMLTQRFERERFAGSTPADQLRDQYYQAFDKMPQGQQRRMQGWAEQRASRNRAGPAVPE